MDKVITIEELGLRVAQVAKEYEEALEAKNEAQRLYAGASNAADDARRNLDKARKDFNDRLEKLSPTPKPQIYPNA